MAPITIVGAGIAGLTAAFELAKAGKPVVVLEKFDEPGGLARSFVYDGFTFDIGPHRFHTDVEPVNHFINDILGPDQIEIKRCSGVYFRGKYHLWPLRLPVLFDLPPSVWLRGLRDLLRMRAREVRSFEDHIVNMYGKTLFDIFFRDYSQKFLGIPPADTDALWAKTGMERALIDKRLKIQKLSHLILSTLIPKGTVTRFIYPANGMVQFCEKLAVRVRGHGGQVLVGKAIDRIDTDGERVTALFANGDRYPVSQVIWTAPITQATRLLGLPTPELPYLAMLLYNVELREPLRLPHAFQWCYYGQKDIVFNRISVPGAFSPHVTPPGRGSICVEVSCRDTDEAWRSPQTLTDRVISDMARVGLLESPADVLAVHAERVPDAYPIYRLGFKEGVSQAEAGIAKFANFQLAGRTGLFWYNNMDNSIEQAQTLAAQVLASPP